MKKIILLIGISIICALSFGCAQQNEDKIDLEKMTAGEILNVLTEQDYPLETKVEFNERGDSNDYPWNLKGCTSAVTWLIPDGALVSAGSGAIEVYETSGACKMRTDSMIGLSSFSAANKYFLQVGKVFIRIPPSLTEQEALQYQAALQAMAKGKTPEPYTPQQDSTDPGKDPDSNGGTEAPLISSFIKVLVNETGEGVGDTHVMSSSESAEFLTIMQEKNWTVVDDFPARDLDAIFTISNNDDDYIFVDGTLYEGKTVILMKYNQDSQGIVYLAPAEVLSALIDFKAGLEAN